MNDYFDLLKEYQELQTTFKNESDNINIIAYYVQSFGISFSSLLKCIDSADPLKDESLLYFTKLYKNLIENLKDTNIFNYEIILPLQKMNESQNAVKSKILNSFNEIKGNLFEAKQKLNNAKKEYFDFLKLNKQNINNKKSDDNLLYEAKKQNYFMLYKYELDKLNAKIEKNNIKYNEVRDELESIKMHKENTYSKALIEFSSIVGEIGNKFIEFEKNIKNKFSNNSNLNIIKNDKNKVRFQKEIIEYDIYNDNKINEIIPQNGNMDMNKEILDKENTKNINNDFDFEILEETISTEEIKINKIMDEIIQKLNEEEEITPTNISELFEMIKYDYSKYALNFFEKIKKYYKDRVISCKTKQNFVHFSNIINNFAIIKDNKIINKIIEVSKMIKYENVFISSMIQKKNPFLSSKTFWMNLIENNFISELSNISANLLKVSVKTLKKEAKNQKIDSKKKLEKKEDILSYLYNQVLGYKKLNKKQKAFLEESSKDSILLIISQSISNMCYFLVSEQSILDIISHYSEIFELGFETFYYFKNVLSVKFQKQYLKIKQNYDEEKEKYGFHMTKNEIILLNASKFLPKENYINIFKLNKDINLKIRKNLLKYQLTRFDIPINERLNIWAIFLNIKEIQKRYNYSLIKKNFLEKVNNPNIKDSEKMKALTIIDLDLDRTPLFRIDEKHKNTASMILKCVCILETTIDYYQGMNFVLLFLYQILNYNEEKTFYFFLGIQKYTKYHELFDNELSDLVTFFKVFEKILEIYYPDIYYSLLDKEIMTQFYSTSWFVTLFTSEITEFRAEKASKFILMAFDNFIYGGWSGLFNAGLSLIYHNKAKIFQYDGNELMRFMIADLNNLNALTEEDFLKLHKLFLNNSEKIKESYIKKLIEIIKFETEHKLLKEKEI